MKRKYLKYYINNKKPFTFPLKKNLARYIVSIKNVYTGKFPKANQLVNINTKGFDSLGGWNDEQENYYLDLNKHFDSIETALKVAKDNKELAIFDSLKNKVINLNK